MIHDLSRVLVAQQTHRRMVDPMSFRRWDKPFAIQRIDTAAPSAPCAQSSPAEPSRDEGAVAGGRGE